MAERLGPPSPAPQGEAAEAVITNATALAAAVAAIRASGRCTLDLEFVPEGRYTPELALVQVSWGAPEQPEVRAVDPLEVDPRPLFELVGDAHVETILHAGQADLSILIAGYEITPRAVWDTQIAAAFLGHGDQIGYAALVGRVLGVSLGKGSQFTDWLKRPLTDRQIAYALDDVRYLPRLWEALHAELIARGRLDWVAEECARLVATADPRPAPAEAYRRVKSWRRLSGAGLGALRAVAAWREEEARRRNRPPGQILNDRSLLEIARARPTTADQIREVRGVPEGLVAREGERLLALVRSGAQDPPSPEPARPPMETHAEVWTTVLQGVVRSAAVESEVAGRFIAARDDLDALTRWWEEGDRSRRPDLPLLRGWRRELVGEAALAWLRGEAALVADAGAAAGLRVEPLPPQGGSHAVDGPSGG